MTDTTESLIGKIKALRKEEPADPVNSLSGFGPSWYNAALQDIVVIIMGDASTRKDEAPASAFSAEPAVATSPTNHTLNDCREAFEANETIRQVIQHHNTSLKGLFERHVKTDDYLWVHVDNLWSAWQAAWNYERREIRLTESQRQDFIDLVMHECSSIRQPATWVVNKIMEKLGATERESGEVK